MITGAIVDPYAPALYSAEQVRNLDRTAIESFGVDGFELMRRAGRAAFRQLRRHWDQVRHITVLCGGGNNGGDGYVIAALAVQQGLSVRCLAVTDPARLQGTALQALAHAREQGVVVESAEALGESGFEQALRSTDLVVDCLLGTGLSGDVRDPFADLISRLNASDVAVLAIDIPSGLCSDTGRVLGCAVEADMTVTFIARKAGLYTGKARDCTGQVIFDDLAVDPAVYNAEPEPVAHYHDWPAASRWLPARRPTTHKGDCGRVLVVGGDQGMGGAGLLAAEAALRTGAGLVFWATRQVHLAAAIARCPEVQARAVEHGNDLDELLEAADVVVLGPGLGKAAWGQQMFQRVCSFQGPVVADADALNLIAASPGILSDHADWIITPHPGEAARLLACATKDIEADRYSAARQLSDRYASTSVLKGAGTVVASSGEPISVVGGGNAGMASAGMGDVLSGVLGALMAQKLTPHRAAITGCALHARAGDIAMRRRGVMGMVASDVIQALSAAVSPGGDSQGEQVGVDE